ncbi:MAG: UvrD-helicase domain-containing protein [Fibromonadaceae bacterium]|jgi:DNA helicase-2/ATP-dependent DNA helicase PcrA|nr:UvrD-helicase domain-containing protein [Fibromonadaceae bacterium]
MLSITPPILQQELNPVQYEAAVAIDEPMLILAGAGSGKTRTIAYKIAHLISYHNVEARRIAAVTFTNKAAKEMKERIANILEFPHIRLDWMGTFHSLSVKILRACLENPAVINKLKWKYTKNFSIYDEDDQKRLLKLIVVPVEGDLANAARMKKISGAISFWKNKNISPDEALIQSIFEEQKILASYYIEYQERLMQANAMDFDDLLLRTIDVLKNIPEISEQFSEHFKYIFVDEYQDTNDAQYILLKLLLSNTNRNITVVGDDDQSIYGWRGANLNIIRSFHRDFAPVKIVKLEENYRSSANIVQAAGSVIANNKRPKEMEKSVFSKQEKGSLIHIKQIADDYTEASALSSKIILSGEEKYSQTAIFYRYNAQSRLIESALNKARIPNIIIGGTRFWDRMEVKDILAYMRLLVNPQDNAALLRVVNVPPRGIGKKTVETLQQNAEKNGTSLWDALSTVPKLETFTKLINSFLQEPVESIVFLTEKIIDYTKYNEYLEKDDPDTADDRKANLNEMLRGVADFCEENPDATLESFLQDISLLTSADRKNENSTNFVTLMTLHSAKGLEFDTVHIVGCDDGILPSRAFESDYTIEEKREKLEEERRLFYVGLTRARKNLYLYTCQSRFWHGEQKSFSPTGFIGEMDASTVYFERLSPAKSNPFTISINRPPQYVPRSLPPKTAQAGRHYDYDDSQIEPTLAGKFAHHNKYGKGKVVGQHGEGENTQVEIMFADGTRRKFVLKYANLSFV